MLASTPAWGRLAGKAAITPAMEREANSDRIIITHGGDYGGN